MEVEPTQREREREKAGALASIDAIVSGHQQRFRANIEAEAFNQIHFIINLTKKMK